MSGPSRRTRGLARVFALALVTSVIAGVNALPASAATKVKVGGSITIGGGGSLTSLDPGKITGGLIGTLEGAAIYGQLLRWNSKTAQYEGYMAEKITPSADFTEWTITLRGPKVKFTSGEPFDAAAVKNHIDRMVDVNRGGTRGGDYRPEVSTVTVKDPQNVVVKLKAANAHFPSVLAYPSWVGSPAYYAKVDAGDKLATPIGAGPYKVSEFRPGESTTVVRNPDFFLGSPPLDQIKFAYIGDAATAYQSFKAGDIQAAVLFGKSLQPLDDAKKNKTPYFEYTNHAGNVIVMNTQTKSVFNDIRLRQAAAEAFDLKYWLDHTQDGIGNPDRHIFPKGTPWYNPANKAVPYNPKNAAKLVAEVKASKPGWDGSVDYVCNNNPETANFGVSLKAMLDPVGFKVNVLQNMSDTVRISRIQTDKNFDMGCWTHSLGDETLARQVALYLGTGTNNNAGNFTSPEMDALIAKWKTTVAHADQQKLVDEMVAIYNKTYPSINLGDRINAIVYSKALKGAIRGGNQGFFYFDTLWLNKGSAK